MITIINYGLGNIKAYEKVYKSLNIDTQFATSSKHLLTATKIILPGVGSFDFAMKQLYKSGMRDTLEKRVLIDQIPVVGICVGMQMLADESEEGSEKGLGWIRGSVRKFDESLIPFKTRLPHMGWNTINPKKDVMIFESIEANSRFYFLHSYYFENQDSSEIICTTEYGITYSSAVNKANIYGIQFHPEKSHSNGVTLLQNFAKL
jgi:glutamine amidotransferase